MAANRSLFTRATTTRAAAGLVALLFLASATAQTWTWKQDGDGNWSNPANWNGPVNGRPFPNGAGHTAVFGNAITADRTVTLDLDINLGTLRFDDDNAYTLQSPAGKQIHFPIAAMPGQVQVVSGGAHRLLPDVFITNDIDFDVPAGLELTVRRITGVGKVGKQGDGAILLTGKQRYRGDTVLRKGTIRLGAVDGCLPRETVLTNAPALGESGLVEFGSVPGTGPGFSHGVKSVRGNVGLKNTHATVLALFAVHDPAENDDWSGPITGLIDLQKFGTSTLVLSGDNLFQGATTIFQGALKLGSETALGPLVSLSSSGPSVGSLDLAGVSPQPFFLMDGTFLTGFRGNRVRNSGAACTFQIGAKQGFVHAYDGSIEDAIALEVLGDGGVKLGGASTYIGGTRVLGTLAVSNPMGSGTGTGAVGVENGGTLAGDGSISGAVTVQDGGQIAPGLEGFTLTVGPLTLKNTSKLAYFLDKPNFVGGQGGNAFLDVKGALTLDGVLNVTTADQGSNFAAGRYRLFGYTGQLTDNGLTIGTFPANFNGTIDAVTIPGFVDLVVTAAGG